MAVFTIFVPATTALRAQSNGRSDATGSASALSTEGPVCASLAAKMMAPYRAVVDGKPLRSLMNDIAAAADFNFWLDRQVDPDQLVTLAAGPRTVFGAIKDSARSVDLEAVAVGNVVVIGQKERVAALIGVLLSMSPDLTGPAQTDGGDWSAIAWPEATTPTEALAVASGLPVEQLPQLPHDLWPSVKWKGLSPDVATLLVTAQFDQMPGNSPAPRALALGQPAPTQFQRPRDNVPSTNKLSKSLVKLESPATVSQNYAAGRISESVRSAAVAADPRADFYTLSPRPASPRGHRPLRMTAQPEAHIAAIHAMLSQSSRQAGPSVDIDNVRFSLRLRFAPAGDVLAQLAAAAGRNLQVSDSASQMIRTPITLTGDDQTLRQLVETVATQSQLRATWTDDALVIDSAE